MKFIHDGMLVIEPDLFRDTRGFFLETYHQRKPRRRRGPGRRPGQSFPLGARHYQGSSAQQLHPQGKLIRVLQGKIFDVLVDIRERLAAVQALDQD